MTRSRRDSEPPALSPGFCVLYRWRLVAGKEAQFQEGWAAMTRELQAQAGALGSRLHRGSDGTWVAYARWPDRQAWKRADPAGPAVAAARAAMDDAIATRMDPVELEPVADLLDEAAPGSAPRAPLPVLRVARSVREPEESARLYAAGLDLELLGRFRDHEGFDGALVGRPGGGYHLEFTRERGRDRANSPDPDDLLVVYVPDITEWEARCDALRNVGFLAVPSHNPYWDRRGRTFQDPDGHRLVLVRDAWKR